MQSIFLLVRKDLLRRRREPLGIVLMITFPLLLAGMLAVAFGTGARYDTWVTAATN